MAWSHFSDASAFMMMAAGFKLFKAVVFGKRSQPVKVRKQLMMEKVLFYFSNNLLPMKETRETRQAVLNVSRF